jgi:DNA-binding PadR family transcriptional regulator
MSTIDLIILGILLEGPSGAYELVTHITEKHISRFLKISTPAIYKGCKRLYESGFLDRKTARKDELSEKAIYSVNKEGKEKFSALMKNFSSNVAPFFLDFNVFLWNIEKIDKKKGLKMLNSLREELANLKQWILKHEKEDLEGAPFASRAIVKQYRMMIITLNVWCDETIKEYTNMK